MKIVPQKALQYSFGCRCVELSLFFIRLRTRDEWMSIDPMDSMSVWWIHHRKRWWYTTAIRGVYLARQSGRAKEWNGIVTCVHCLWSWCLWIVCCVLLSNRKFNHLCHPQQQSTTTISFGRSFRCFFEIVHLIRICRNERFQMWNLKNNCFVCCHL